MTDQINSSIKDKLIDIIDIAIMKALNLSDCEYQIVSPSVEAADEILKDFFILSKDVDTTSKTAMYHLGKVLYILQDLTDDDRCKALDNAIDFWNKNNPNNKILPSGLGYTCIVEKTFNIDKDFDPSKMPTYKE